MTWDTLILNRSGREQLAHRTKVRLLHEACWRHEPKVIRYDDLFDHLETGAAHTLILEDDLEFNAHFTENIEDWLPRVASHFALASLFQGPNTRLLPEHSLPEQFHTLAAVPPTHHALALIVPRATVEFAIQGWEMYRDAPVVRLMRLAFMCGPVIFHTPSLVQSGNESVGWNREPLLAVDYDPAWKHI